MNDSYRKFQFLIGTLKTLDGDRYLLIRANVSIPHRYAKNGHKKTPSWVSLDVSIPHRYAKNIVKFVYIFHHFVVSIPHRYAKNKDS